MADAIAARWDVFAANVATPQARVNVETKVVQGDDDDEQ